MEGHEGGGIHLGPEAQDDRVELLEAQGAQGLRLAGVENDRLGGVVPDLLHLLGVSVDGQDLVAGLV